MVEVGREKTYFRPAPQPVPATMPPPCLPFHEQEYFPPPCCWHPNWPWPSVHHCQGAFWRGERASVGAARVEGRRAQAVARSAVRETILKFIRFNSFRVSGRAVLLFFSNFAISPNEGYNPLIYIHTYLYQEHTIPFSQKTSQAQPTSLASPPVPRSPSHRQSHPSEN